VLELPANVVVFRVFFARNDIFLGYFFVLVDDGAFVGFEGSLLRFVLVLSTV
jgi:hypothetical protein